MPLRFYSWCSTRGAHGNFAPVLPVVFAFLHEIIEKKRPNEKQFAFYTRKTDAQSFFDKGFLS